MPEFRGEWESVTVKEQSGAALGRQPHPEGFPFIYLKSHQSRAKKTPEEKKKKEKTPPSSSPARK